MRPNNIIYTVQNFAPMTFSELSYKLFANYQAGAITDEQLVQIIEKATSYLNLQTITNYAKSERISYNGAKKRTVALICIDGIKFIINNG